MTIQQTIRQDAKRVREHYLKKSFPKGNVTVIELHLKNGITLGTGATSRQNSPTPKPISQSEGGQFEPGIDLYSNRLMDTDAEYKALSAIAYTLDMFYHPYIEGRLYLYTERKPCESCQGVIQQFREKFPNIEVDVSWDYPYP